VQQLQLHILINIITHRTAREDDNMGFMTRRVVAQALSKVDTGRKDWGAAAKAPLVDAVDTARALRSCGMEPFGHLGTGILENTMRKKMEHVKEQFSEKNGTNLLQKAISAVEKMRKAVIAGVCVAAVGAAGALATMALYVTMVIPYSYGKGIVTAAALYCLYPLYLGIKDARLHTLANVLKKAGES
jgi:hypothetical protein